MGRPDIIEGMGFFRRAAEKLNPARGRSNKAGGGSARVDDSVALYLTEFVRTRRGVEAFVEPRTIVTETTVLLVAWDGEWTRRRVPSPQWAYAFAESLKIPGYDALVVGYPQRMRDYNTRLTRKVEDKKAPESGPQRPGPWTPDFADAASEDREFADDLEEEFRLPPSTHPDPPSDLR